MGARSFMGRGLDIGEKSEVDFSGSITSLGPRSRLLLVVKWVQRAGCNRLQGISSGVGDNH